MMQRFHFIDLDCKILKSIDIEAETLKEAFEKSWNKLSRSEQEICGD